MKFADHKNDLNFKGSIAIKDIKIVNPYQVPKIEEIENLRKRK